MKTVFFYLILALLLFPLARFCEKETAGFSVLKIAQARTAENESALPDNLFAQKFTYLGRGGQSFAFVSDDGKTVLKFLKRRFSPSFLLPNFASCLAQKKEQYVQKKWERDARSYALAFEQLKEESGLIALHLHKTKSQKITIVDKLGIAHKIDLGNLAYIVQKHATPLLQDLSEKIERHQIDAAKETLKSVVELVCLRCKRGIADEDPRLQKNLGLIDGHPIFIDIGRFKNEETLKKSATCQAHLTHVTSRLHAWLVQQDPALASYLQEQIRNVLD